MGTMPRTRQQHATIGSRTRGNLVPRCQQATGPKKGAILWPRNGRQKGEGRQSALTVWGAKFGPHGGGQFWGRASGKTSAGQRKSSSPEVCCPRMQPHGLTFHASAAQWGACKPSHHHMLVTLMHTCCSLLPTTQFTCLCEGHCAAALAPSFSRTALAMASAVFSAACPKDAARLRCVTGDVLVVQPEDAVWLPSKAFRVGEYMQKQFRKKDILQTPKPLQRPLEA